MHFLLGKCSEANSGGMIKDIEVMYETYERGDIVLVNSDIFYEQWACYNIGEEVIGIVLYSYEKDCSYNSCYEVFVKNRVITTYYNEIRKL